MPKIIISYRRSDTQAVSGRIFDRLASRYGKENVFIDIDTIPFGVDFREHVNTALEDCEVMLAIIGPGWVGDRRKGKSIWAENDWVRIEIEAALRRRVPLVPVLVGGTSIPSLSALPESMSDLSYRNGIEVDLGRDFHTHMDRLIKSLDALRVAQKRLPSSPGVVAETYRSGNAENETDIAVIGRTQQPSGLMNKFTLLFAGGLAMAVIIIQFFALDSDMNEIEVMARGIFSAPVEIVRSPVN